MKKILPGIFCLSFVALLMGGCKVKDKNPETKNTIASPKQNKAWLLAGDEYKAWAVESFTVNGLDQLKDMKACQLDNVDVYFRNLSLESHEGASRCHDNDPDIFSRGKWSFNADSSAIEIKLGSNLLQLDIVELTKNRFHYRSEVKSQITEAVLVATDYKPAN